MTGRILALTRYDRLGASSRVRMLQYIPHLEARGLNIAVQALFSDSDLRQLYRTGSRSYLSLAAAFVNRLAAVLRANTSDVIWLQQELFPFLPFAAEKGLLGGRRVVIDFDDANYLYYRGMNQLVRNALGSKSEQLMALADAVVVGNDHLANYARAAGARNVHLVYSAVDVESLKAASLARKPDGFTVGWIGTPMTARQSFDVLRAPLVRFLAETGAKCILVGVEPDQFPELPAERVSWSEAREADCLARMSVGLCPLEDNEWTRGKSGYKIIQYMAAGKATLASPVGIAARLVRPEETGLHCVSADDWYAAMTRLYRDQATNANMGARALEIAREHYDVGTAARQLYDILKADRV